MARKHERLMFGTLGPGASDIYTVTVGRKMLVSAMSISAVTPVIAAEFEIFITPNGGVEVMVQKGEINPADGRPNPWPDDEPWWTLYSGDGLRLKCTSSVGGPNINYVVSGIEYDPP